MNPAQVDRPILPAVGHPAFGMHPGGARRLRCRRRDPARARPGVPRVPADRAGLPRRLDDHTATGQFRPGFPTAVNDLQFLTGPSIADIDGLPGEELVEGTASKDLVALSAAGTPTDRLAEGDHRLDGRQPADRLVRHARHRGGREQGRDRRDSLRLPQRLLDRGAACSPASWPRFHHDNANSGDYDRDAALPGRPVRRGGRRHDAELQRARRRPALRHRRPLRDRHLAEPDRRDQLRRGDARSRSRPPRRRAGSGRPYAIPTTAPATSPSAPSTSRATSAGRRPSTTAARRAPAAVAGGGGGGGPAAVAAPGGAGYEDCANAITGTADKDSLKGTSGDDRIRGRGGDDRIKGRGGDDCLSGQRGEDRVTGGSGADLIKGGRGKRPALGRLGRRRDPRPPRRPRPDQLRRRRRHRLRQPQARPGREELRDGSRRLARATGARRSARRRGCRPSSSAPARRSCPRREARAGPSRAPCGCSSP